MSIAETFSAAELNAIQHEARKLDRIPGYEYDQDNWQINPADPSRLMPLFHPLRLKNGFVLRAYLREARWGAGGLVYAFPATSLFPKAEDCMRDNPKGMMIPMPEEALANPMLAVEGDNTPRAFLMAALLRRELREFGALWHGLNWRTHTIIDEKVFYPKDSSAEFVSGNEAIDITGSDWEHIQPIPEDLRPKVRITRRGGAEVEYCTYSPYGMQSVYRHFEVYAPDNLVPRTSYRILAKGSCGLMH